MVDLPPSIERALRDCEAEGNSVREVSVGWSEVRQVIHMQFDISDLLWANLQREEPTLRAWDAKATPHNRPDRGFTDEQSGVAISFPR